MQFSTTSQRFILCGFQYVEKMGRKGKTKQKKERERGSRKYQKHTVNNVLCTLQLPKYGMIPQALAEKRSLDFFAVIIRLAIKTIIMILRDHKSYSVLWVSERLNAHISMIKIAREASYVILGIEFYLFPSKNKCKGHFLFHKFDQ